MRPLESTLTSMSLSGCVCELCIVISGNVRGAICNKSIRVSQQSQ